MATNRSKKCLLMHQIKIKRKEQIGELTYKRNNTFLFLHQNACIFFDLIYNSNFVIDFITRLRTWGQTSKYTLGP